MSDRSIAHLADSNQIEIAVEAQRRAHTRYGGAVAVQQAWDRFGSEAVLAEAGITYGREEDRAPDMSLAMTLGSLVGADSIKRVAERFGGEPAPLERDEALAQMITQPFSQRRLDRFVTHPRHDWYQLQWARVARLQDQVGFRMRPEGVVILDDFPLPKPHAREMAYLTPVWDNNLKRKVRGYLIVHLFYHHPARWSYPLYMEPWLKTSATGETSSKGGARRRARPDEERSRLDIGLEAIEELVARALPCAAIVMDSWYTARWLCYELSQLGLAWVGEASTNRKFLVDGEPLEVATIWDRYADRLESLWLPGRTTPVQAYALPAIMDADQYTPAQTVLLVLTEGLHEPRDTDDGRRLLVCNRRRWSPRRIVRLFSYRPRIERCHRECKQHKGWLDVHTRRLQGLACHLALSLMRDALLRLLRVWVPALDRYSLRELIAHWIGYVADLSWSPAGRLRLHIGADHPALAFIVDTGPS